MGSLSGQVALVTGASRGIGRAVALRLAAEGAAVGVTARSALDLDTTVLEIAEGGGTAVAVPGDAAVPSSVESIVTAIEDQIGSIDILVNNAGRAMPETLPFVEIDPGDWWAVMEVNVRGPMLFSRALLPGMVTRHSGRIFNMASLVAGRTIQGFSPYAVSKAALIRFGEFLTAELEGTGVQVFNVSPGLVRTSMSEGIEVFRNLPDEEWTPIERIGDMLVELCDPRHDALSGWFIHVEDDLSDLLKAAESGEQELRQMRLKPYGPTDEVLD